MISIPDNRSVSPVVGTIFIVAVIVVLAATVGATMLGYGDDLRDLTAPMTYGENLIENPGFEDGDANWNLTWGGSIADGDGVDGSNALLVNGSEYVDQELDAVLLPDAEYQLCIETRLKSEDDGEAWVGVQRDTGGENIHLTSWEVTWDDYRNQCKYIKTNREYKNISVWVWTDGEREVLADDFVLQRTRFLTDAR